MYCIYISSKNEIIIRNARVITDTEADCYMDKYNTTTTTLNVVLSVNKLHYAESTTASTSVTVSSRPSVESFENIIFESSETVILTINGMHFDVIQSGIAEANCTFANIYHSTLAVVNSTQSTCAVPSAVFRFKEIEVSLSLSGVRFNSESAGLLKVVEPPLLLSASPWVLSFHFS